MTDLGPHVSVGKLFTETRSRLIFFNGPLETCFGFFYFDFRQVLREA